MRFERTKVKGNTIIEVYKYPHETFKKEFYDHRKIMYARGYKSIKGKDTKDDKGISVTYEKQITVYKQNTICGRS